MIIPGQLVTLIREQSSIQFPESVKALSEAILDLYGDAVEAIIFYGSCLRKGDDPDGLADLYVLVDNYRHAFKKISYAFLNKLLPPNVFYLEIPYKGGIRRAKYAVFSFMDFQRGTSMRWFHSYLWGRLAQPVCVPYSRNDKIRDKVYLALAGATMTFISRVLPCMPLKFTSRELWCKGLSLSYQSELRSERPDKLADLYDAYPYYYEKLTCAAMTMSQFSTETIHHTDRQYFLSGTPAITRIFSRFKWRVRFIQGKILSVLRLIKGLATFQGGLKYILWKIERHSGVTVEIAPSLRRIPLIWVLVLFWRLYRKGAFR